jgi:cyclopropane fatty-acyl-phospholipid synthase-like methyltransferase
MTTQTPFSIRVDHELIAEMIEPGSRVLDVGCGDGELSIMPFYR